jgi:Lon protease-like protein
LSTFEIPLFPLRTVLVPGGHLPLRIFEPRYLDMVRDCSRNDRGFGVCLLFRGSETGPTRQHARTGTLARIRDFHTNDSGLLCITAQGYERFTIEQTRTRDNGLLVAAVTWLDEAAEVVLPEDYYLLSRIVERFMEKVGPNYPDYRPALLDDAVWVGYRLTELLPLTNAERLGLLELNDPLARLQILLETLPRFQPDDPA